MAFAAGEQLGPYKIVAPIGKGGMGEVYRAHDSRLNRDVAIKVSSSEFSERFTREARAIASLNHTNICHLYDVGPNYLVMELVEGEDLRGPLDFNDALPLILQLIDGIEAAHEKSIVHRDLKPANIKVTREGVVKILDFGLAKAIEGPASSDSNTANSPTLTLDETKAGVILGTAAYMAPEQAKGKTADKRSDIWSFGVIVYELLTGKRLFQGESVVDLLGNVINQDPDLSAAPVRAHKLLRWCLEKDRKDRLQSIGDARRLLKETSSPEAAVIATKPLHRLPLVWLLASIAAFSLAYSVWRSNSAPANPAVRLTIALPQGQEITTAPAITLDGKTIAYTAKQGSDEPLLYLRDLNSFDARVAAGSSGAQYPFFSPDGKWLAFFSQGKLRKVEVAGGSPTDLADSPYPYGGSWGDDDSIVYTISIGAGLFRIPASGGTPQSISKPDGASKGYAHVFPQVLPGSKKVLFTSWGFSQGAQILDLASGTFELVLPQKDFTTALFEGTAQSAGRLLIHDSVAGLKAAPLDFNRPSLTSANTFVMANVYYDVENEPRPWLATSNLGSAVYAPGNPARASLVWIERDGKTSPAVNELGPYREVSLSPDGSKAIIRHSLDLWIHDLARGTRSALTAGSGNNMLPRWSQDGSRLVFASNRAGSWDIYSQSSNASQQAEPLLKVPLDQFPNSMLPDGTLLYREIHPKTGVDLWVRSPDGKTSPFRVTQFNEGAAQFSPITNGKIRWVAYSSDESGRNEIFLQSFPGGELRFPVSNGGGIQPCWSRDGKELFYLGGTSLMSVSIGPDGSMGVPKKLFALPDLVISPRYQSYDVSPDGKRFLMQLREPGSIPRQLNVILNWSN